MAADEVGGAVSVHCLKLSQGHRVDRSPAQVYSIADSTHCQVNGQDSSVLSPAGLGSRHAAVGDGEQGGGRLC